MERETKGALERFGETEKERLEVVYKGRDKEREERV